MEADNVEEEGATTPPIHTSVGTIGTRATVADLMYRAGTLVPRAHGNVARTDIRKDTHKKTQMHILKLVTNLVWWPATRNILSSQELHGANDC